MRWLSLICVLVACGGGGTDPHIVAGGGITDGKIDGKVFVFVIDDQSDEPIANATVAIGAQMLTTDAKGFAEFKDVKGPQDIAVKMQGYRSVVWAAANGKNVTIPITKTAIDQATLSGGIANWASITVPANHVKAAAVFYSHSDLVNGEANDINTPLMMNICLGQMAVCNWTINTRTGNLTLLAAIVDRDTKGTATPDDDTQTITGWATLGGIVAQAGSNQSGLMLNIVEAGNLQNLTIDYGTPPAALTQHAALVGIEIGEDEIVQIPFFLTTDTTLLAPKPSVFAGSTGTLRLTGVAQTTMGELGAQSIVLRRNLMGTSLSTGTWLDPPTGVTAARTTASWTPVSGAKLQSVQYRDATDGILLDITVFDAAVTTVAIPALVGLPVSGVLHARVSGIGADIDPQDFSLEEDEDKLFAIAMQPMTIN
jgi:hypothetical protein